MCVTLSGCPGQPGVPDVWGMPSGNVLWIPAGVSSYTFYIQLLLWLETFASCQPQSKWWSALSNKWPPGLFSVSCLLHSTWVMDPGVEHPWPSRRKCLLWLELTCFMPMQTAESLHPWNNQFIINGMIHWGPQREFLAVVSTWRAKGLFYGVHSRVAGDGSK